MPPPATLRAGTAMDRARLILDHPHCLGITVRYPYPGTRLHFCRTCACTPLAADLPLRLVYVVPVETLCSRCRTLLHPEPVPTTEPAGPVPLGLCLADPSAEAEAATSG